MRTLIHHRFCMSKTTYIRLIGLVITYFLVDALVTAEKTSPTPTCTMVPPIPTLTTLAHTVGPSTPSPVPLASMVGHQVTPGPHTIPPTTTPILAALPTPTTPVTIDVLASQRLVMPSPEEINSMLSEMDTEEEKDNEDVVEKEVEEVPPEDTPLPATPIKLPLWPMW